MSLSQIYLGLGSNAQPVLHLCAALDALEQQFGELQCSPVFESAAIGSQSGRFLNMVVGLQTQLGVEQLIACLKQLEIEHGRKAGVGEPVPLDMDLLLYENLVGRYAGVELPRGEILHNAFVLYPLALLIPQQQHPVSGQSYAQLWQQMPHKQELVPYAMRWKNRFLG